MNYLDKVNQLIAEVKLASEASGADGATIKKMVSDALKLQPVRKGSFDEDDDSVNGASVLLKSTKVAKIVELQKRNDDMYILSKLLRVDPRALKMYSKHQGSELAKAMYNSAGVGSEWIPTGFSADLQDRVALEVKVAALFDRISMPQNPFTLPIKSSGATPYLLGEAASETESATKITKTEVVSTNVTLTAKKLGMRINFSEELSEDSIIPVLPMVKDELVRALAEGEENAIINGDTTGTHQDSNVSSATDVQKAFLGLRKLTNSGAKVNISSFNAENFRAIRTAMGKYGVMPSKLAVICGISGYIQLLSLKDSSGNPLVITMDKYGSNATILTGELGKIDGMPVIVSEYVKENLNATGVYDGTTTTKTVLLLVYRPGLVIGDRRKVTVKVDEDIQTDQTIVVATQRIAFSRRLVATEKFIGLGYNLTS